jgi:acyl-CoA dehydrogenase
LRERVRRFVSEEVIPLESTDSSNVDEARIAALQNRAKELGLWMYDVPKKYGGQGYGLVATCVVEEEMGRTKGVPFRQNEILGPRIGPILYSLSPEQEERYLWPVLRGEKKACFAQTEPDAGSDPASMRTHARLDGEHYVLNGVKRFIGRARDADFAQVICVTAEGADVAGRLSCLLVDMDSPGVRLVRPWPTMMGDTPWEISFENVRVPAANLVNQAGAGMKLSQAWVTRNRIAKHGARSLGIAQRAVDLAMERATQRTTFGAPLADRQAVQFYIADSCIELRQARLLVYDVAREFDEGRDVRDGSYMVKVACTEMASRVVDRAIQIHGAIGLTPDLPLEYFFRQMRSLRITEGATEVLRWRLARNILRARSSTDGGQSPNAKQ